MNSKSMSFTDLHLVTFQNKLRLIKPKEAQDLSSSSQRELNLVLSCGKQKNIKEIFNLEQEILFVAKREIEEGFRINIKQELESINAGIHRMDKASNNFQNVYKFADYKGCIALCTDYDASCLPKDAVRQSVSGQKVSIKNQMRAKLDDDDKALLQARLDNLSIAETKYISLQHLQMKQFIKKQPDHFMSKLYLSKPQNIEIQKRLADSIEKKVNFNQKHVSSVKKQDVER